MIAALSFDALLLAAGLGTRLRPLTNRTPKPLLEVGGVAMLERVARRVIAAGADRLIINVHHLPEQIEAFVRSRRGFGVDVRFSYEPGAAPLDTGGALVHAREHLRGDRPILIHNADVISDVSLERLLEDHVASGALVSLVVMRRETSRALLFDGSGLCGYTTRAGERVLARQPQGEPESFGFSGIHAASPTLIDRLTERGTFSIITAYMRLSREGARILPFRADGSHWIDIGSPERLERAQREIEHLDDGTV
ncbi:MAG: nucleotidyltransferase family protein [Longimicrobiales bacterium]